jgi:hypothetical protein
MKNLLKIIGIGILLYLAYKAGKHNEEDKESDNTVPKVSQEETYIREIIDELKSKTNKTRKDKDNIDLLLLKLKQILK